MSGRDCVANQCFGPILCFLLAHLVRGHRRVAGGEVPPRHVRTRYVVQEAADSSPTDHTVQAIIDLGFNRDS
jgi:hypothetical protein